MGYTTEFTGKVILNKSLDDDTYNFLKKFNETRRMARKVDKKYGIEGEFYVDGKGFAGQDDDGTVIDHNRPPKTQPGLWCQWVPSEDKMSIEWDGGEKFYSSYEWMVYLIDKVLAPKGYICNGTIEAQGEGTDDHWWLVVKNNKVSQKTLFDLQVAEEKLMIYETSKEELPLLINYPWISETNKAFYNEFLKNIKVKK